MRVKQTVTNAPWKFENTTTKRLYLKEVSSMSWFIPHNKRSLLISLQTAELSIIMEILSAV